VRTRVKICGITNADDALAAAQAGADAVGFVFVDTSPRCVDIATVAAILPQLPPFVTTVGLFMNNSSATVSAVLDKLELDLLQFHGQETASYCEQFGQRYIKAISMGGDANPKVEAAQHKLALGFLCDSHAPGEAGGSGKTFDWTKLPQLVKPVILAGGLRVENVADAVRQVRPWAVDVSSGVEAARGKKDHAKIAAFIEQVKQGDQSK
jgi:phosphoribosylanthranilate isomerase